MQPLMTDVSALLDRPGESLAVRAEWDLDHLTIGTESYSLRGPVLIDVSVTNAGGGLVVRGSARAVAAASCSRCLKPFDLTLDGEIESLFTFEPVEDGDDELSGSVDDEGFIDLTAVVIAALVIETPLAPLHDEECAGLCPQCGADLNEGPCGCAGCPDDDHPFAALGALLPSEADDDRL